MGNNDFSLLVKAKLDTSEITSRLNEIKNKYGNFKVKLEFDKMPNLSGQMQKEGNKAGQAYSDAFKKAMSEKIQFKLDTGDFQTKIDSIQAKIKSLGSISDATRSNVDLLGEAFKVLKSGDSIEKKIEAFKQFNALLPTIRSQLSNTANAFRDTGKNAKEAAEAAERLTMMKSGTLSNNIQTWMNNNKKAAKEYGDELRKLQDQLKNNTDPSKLKDVSARFQEIKSEAGAAGLTVNQWGLQFKNAITMALGIGSVYQIVNKVIQVTKEMVKQTIELEDAMAQLRIVTRATEQDYAKFYQTAVKNAKEIGGSVIDLTEAATTYARLGYSLDESNVLAKYTSMLQAVGDIDVSSAENAMTAIFKAFDLNINDIESIMDKLIEVGKMLPNGIVICRKKEAISVKTGLVYYASKTEERLAV